MTGARTPSPGRPRRIPAGLRQWPEFTAAGLVLALGLGLGSLLLDGKRQPPEPVAAAPQPTSAIPVSPGAVTGSSQAAPAPASAQSQTTAGTIPPAPATPPAPKIPPPVLPEPRRLPDPPTPAKQTDATTPGTSSPIASAPGAQAPAAQIPAAQIPAAQAPAAQAPSPPGVASTEPAQPQAEAPATPEAATPAQSEPETPAPPPNAATPNPGAPAVTPSAQRTPLRSEYRVMLGTFGSEAALRSATAGVEALGYTVYAIDLGNQFVAQVGPFTDEASGQQAAADIRRAYAQAELYPPRGRTLQTPAQAAAEAPMPAPAAPDTSASASEPEAPAEAAVPPATLPAPAGPVYVQVGAFNNVEGAQRFVEQLRAQGFSPSVNAPETGKVTVLLGPLSGDTLLAAEGRLDAAGLDHFRLR